jgi:hypothetical protein
VSAEGHDRLRTTVRAFLNLIENGSDQPDPKLALLLDQLALARHGVADPAEPDEGGGLQRKEYEQALSLVKLRFPEFGYYKVTEVLGDVHDPGALIGDAASDIVHIYTELDVVEQIWSKDGERAATGYFASTFDMHWGGHLRWLQVYLHELRRN